MPQNEEQNLFAGYFNLVALRQKVRMTLADEMEKVKKLKKQLREIDEQMDKNSNEIIKTVRERGELSGKVTLDDFFDE